MEKCSLRASIRGNSGMSNSHLASEIRFAALQNRNSRPCCLTRRAIALICDTKHFQLVFEMLRHACV
jgi:hypothetical protein